MKKYDILIGCHSEDMDWMRFIPKDRNYRVVVSNSNNRSNFENCDLLLPRENYGREAGHFFHYMVEMYDNLPETTVFIQGDPWPHAAAGGYILTMMEILFGDPEFIWPISYLGKSYTPTALLASPDSTQYRALKAGLGDLEIGKGIPISIGAEFYAKKKTILSRPKEAYQRFLEYAKDKKNYPDDPYYTLAHDLEGVWGGVFAHASGKRSI